MVKIFSSSSRTSAEYFCGREKKLSCRFRGSLCARGCWRGLFFSAQRRSSVKWTGRWEGPVRSFPAAWPVYAAAFRTARSKEKRSFLTCWPSDALSHWKRALSKGLDGRSKCQSMRSHLTLRFLPLFQLSSFQLTWKMENKTPGVPAIAVCFQAFHFEYPNENSISQFSTLCSIFGVNFMKL